MRAALKSIFCLDMPTVDLEHWVPETKEFGFKIMLFIGTEDDQKSDAFDAFVCTPGFFAANLADDQIAAGQHTFFVKRFDYLKLRQCIEDYVSRCEGNTWPEVAKKLAHIGSWEFDDFNTRILQMPGTLPIKSS
jgi:hypothetical protein